METMRRFKLWFAFALVFLVGVGVGFAVGQYRSQPSPIVILGTTDHFPIGSVTHLELPTRFYDSQHPPRGPQAPNAIGLISPVPVFIVHDPSGAFYAFYDRDTHSTCHLKWVEDKQRFEDPCHGAKYTRTGDYLEGPAPRGLDRFQVSVTQDGAVRVDVNVFQPGAPHG